ncbi:hypothetical protein THAOC_18179, partial [Thalassiosira oceanica]
MLSDIRAAVRAIGPKVLGFTSNDVGTHSVRSSFAMMAYLAKEPVYTIMLIGRWSSTAFLSYIEPQIKEFTGGVSKRMLTHETFFHVSGATNPPDDTPTDREVTDDGAGEDNTGSKTTGTYNYWCLELHFAGGGTALRNQGDLFLGFLEGDIVGEVATGRLSMILDIVSGVKRTLATCLAPHLGVTPKGDSYLSRDPDRPDGPQFLVTFFIFAT